MIQKFITMLTACLAVAVSGAAGEPVADEMKTTPTWTLPGPDYLDHVQASADLGWADPTPETQPGAYWWWPGSAVTKEDLTWNLETYHAAGWGNMGVIGIYGVRGEEKRFIDFFTPEWFDMYNHAMREARRLGMNIDLTPSSGWRLGGPHIDEAHGEMSFSVKNGGLAVTPRDSKVKRAGPGGEGRAVNPYSPSAIAYHLDWLASRFEEGNGLPPRAFYYDSFENPGNWCRELPDAFIDRHGYDLRDYVEALAGDGDPMTARRVLYDYRVTLSDLLVGRVGQIGHWAAERGSGLRVQAHGAPANLLDMYAAGSIPETEVFGANRFDIPGYRRDPQWCNSDTPSALVNRFASSAAHVAGKDLIIAESFTWLRNHYHTALSHMKAEADALFLNGINGIYYHGTCFSPKVTEWPGWLFYASVQANARNSIFRDIPALNQYITRCQGVLQEGAPFNDVLVYWPVHDQWMEPADRRLEKRFQVHHTDWIEDTDCGRAARRLIDDGYTFDFISDAQLARTRVDGGGLRTEGGHTYRAILLPAPDFMLPESLGRPLDLAEQGATLLIWKHGPSDVPGLADLTTRAVRLQELSRNLPTADEGARAHGKGQIVLSDELGELLAVAGVPREAMASRGLRFIRRVSKDHVIYFVANQTDHAVDGWIPLSVDCTSAVLMDPMRGRSGVAPLRPSSGRTEIYLQVEPGETRIVRVYSGKKVAGPAWPILRAVGEPIVLDGPWRIRFVEGGPELPGNIEIRNLYSWTELGDVEAERFAGAARYSVAVDLPDDTAANHWILNLGDVRESARVRINGRPVGMVVAHPFRLDVSAFLQPGANEIEIEVTNLSANRIRDLDLRRIKWKKFHNINMRNQNYKKLRADQWDLKPSGLLGPVTLQAMRPEMSI